MSPARTMSRNPALRRLLCGFGLLNVAEWGFVAALSVHAYRTGGALDVGLIGVRFVAGALSSALLAPMVVSRRGVLTLSSLLRGCLLAAGALTAISASAFLLLLLFVVLDSVAAATYRPAQSRLMPSLARSPDELTSAVAGSSLAKTLGQATGALLGGIAVQFVTPATAMAGEAGLMLLVPLCTLGVGGAPAVEREGSTRRLASGLLAFPSVIGDVHARPLIIASVLRTLVRGLWGALLVVVALRQLHAGSSSVGLLQAASGVGVLSALPLTVSQIGRPRLALPCLMSFIAAGAAVGLVSIAPALVIVAVLVFIWGAAMAVADATSLSLLHRLLPTVAFSRTLTVMESLKLMTEAAGALLAPALVALFGVRGALFASGLPLPLLMGATWQRLRRSEEVAAGRGAVVGRLHRVPLFAGLDMSSIEQLAAHALMLVAAAGEEVIVQGQDGDRFYVIVSGVAEVVIDGFKVRELTESDEFGERALMRNTPRTATVRALSDMRLLAVDREAFLEAVTGESGLRFEPETLLERPLDELLQRVPLLAHAPAEALSALARSAHHERFAAREVIFDHGDPSPVAYVLLQGRVELQRDGAVDAVLLPGDSFGELSAMHGTPRRAKAVAAQAAVALVLPAAALLQLSLPSVTEVTA